ncbi:MAG: hypothetical protein ACWA47_00370 [Brevirhabdus sp.]
MPQWVYIIGGIAALIFIAAIAEAALRKPGRRPLVDMRPTDFDEQEEAREELGLEATDMELVERTARANNMLGLQYGASWPGFRSSKGRNAK